MVSIEEYQLAYARYYEGKLLEATNMAIELNSVAEETSIVVQEDVRENIRKYVVKIIERIQNVWNKYKENFQHAKMEYNNNTIEDAINNHDIEISIQNYSQIDVDQLNNIQVQALDFNLMKDYLDSKEDFMQRYYPQYVPDQGKSIADTIREKCTKNKSDNYQLTKNDLLDMYDYVKNWTNQRDNIQRDIDNINQASQNAQTIAEAVVMEADDDKQTIVNNAEEKDNDQNQPTTANNGNDEDKKSDSSDKKVQTYFACVTEIMTAKMTISRELYNLYNNIINTQVKNVKKEEKNQAQPANNPAPNITTPQIT